jgi:hypothetical protein
MGQAAVGTNIDPYRVTRSRADVPLGLFEMATLARILSATSSIITPDSNSHGCHITPDSNLVWNNHLRPTVTHTGLTESLSGYRVNHMLRCRFASVVLGECANRRVSRMRYHVRRRGRLMTITKFRWDAYGKQRPNPTTFCAIQIRYAARCQACL